MKTSIYFYILLSSLFISCNANDSENIQKEETLMNISYGSSNQQVFDLYLPANRTSATKTLILVHGGGWIEGDKADMNGAVGIIKQNLPDYAIANINYRLATAANPAFPMQIDDVASVINKLKNGNYNISDDFGFIGISAGGHLSMLYSYAHDSGNNIKMVCSIVGPTNFTDSNYVNNPQFVTTFEGITGVSYQNDPEYYEEISPYHRATSSSPATLLFYGNQDPLIPTSQGTDLHLKLDNLSVYNEFTLYNGGHGDWSATDQIDMYSKLLAFVNSRF